MARFFSSRKFHLIMITVWAALIIPTLLWWKNSILWVLIISIYASIAAHWSAFQGARAEHRAGKQARHL